MLDFYAVDVVTQSRSLDRTYLGGLEIDEFDELIRFNIVSSQPSSFNSLFYFQDRYLSNDVVKKWLTLAEKQYSKGQKTPGYRSHGVEKFISFCRAVVQSKSDLQMLCD